VTSASEFGSKLSTDKEAQQKSAMMVLHTKTAVYSGYLLPSEAHYLLEGFASTCVVMVGGNRQVRGYLSMWMTSTCTKPAAHTRRGMHAIGSTELGG